MGKVEYKRLSGELPCVDVWKFLLAFAVVAIHIKFFFKGFVYPLGISWFLSFAVPFYFIVMGFLLARKLMDKRKEEQLIILKERSKRLFRLFGIWLLIYLPITIYNRFEENLPLFKFIISYIISILCRGETYLAWPLWFIYAAAIFHGFLFIVKKYINKNGIVLLFIFFLIVSLISFFLNEVSLSKYQSLVSQILNRPLGGVYTS